jgi:hypothetical protein
MVDDLTRFWPRHRTTGHDPAQASDAAGGLHVFSDLNSVWTLAFRPDGATMVSGPGDFTVRL